MIKVPHSDWHVDMIWFVGFFVLLLIIGLFFFLF
jgi:hypothetical protein